MCMKYMFLMLVVCLLFSACSRDIVVINSVVTAEIEGQISNETGNTVETGEREPCMTLSIEPKNVVRDGDTTELMLTVSCDSPNTILYGAKSYPIYYWDEQSRTWISDPENFDLTTDEGMGFVGLKEIPITLDLDGFYANDGVYMIAFTAREMEEPKREYMETVTFQIKGDINKE